MVELTYQILMWRGQPIDQMDRQQLIEVVTSLAAKVEHQQAEILDLEIKLVNQGR